MGKCNPHLDILSRKSKNDTDQLFSWLSLKVDAGKSSTLGVLTRGGLDDGRGKARVNLFRHKHEIESGRTSSVGMEIMGFDTKGGVVMNVDKKNPAEPGRKMSWEEVCEKSAKVISFIDLAGHEVRERERQ
jgi:GTPase